MVEGAGACSDLLYGSGFAPVDPVVFLDEGKRRTLVVPMLEYSRARQEAADSQVWLPEKLGLAPAERRRPGAQAVALLAARKVKRVRVGAAFPALVLRALETAGVKVDIETGTLYPERARKHPAEIAAIRVSQRAAVAAMRAGIDFIRAATIGRGDRLLHQGKTLTSERVREEIDTVLLRHGCLARDTIVAGGAQAADPHERGHGPLFAHTSIVLDIFPQHKTSGYWGDITRTVCRGAAPPELTRMYRSVLTAQRAALAAVKHGAAARAIHDAVSAQFVAAGYPTTVRDGVVRGFFHGTGHGVGLDIHEAPSISLAEVTLATGHVVTVEPGLYDPDIGGVRIEDTVAVERGGARMLASYPKRLEI
jgi:Xaa-Pro aminopeptidase